MRSFAPARSPKQASPSPAKARADSPPPVHRSAPSPHLGHDFSRIRIHAPGDGYEREADRISGQVLRMSEPPLRSFPANTTASHGAGQPLDPATRAFMEPRFGYDFSQVRVHTDEQAARSANSIQARAYTLSRDVVFARGQYAPQTQTGRGLLAHELTHVLQQSRGGAMPSSFGSPLPVTAAAEIGIARKSLFEEFSAGKYSWPFLRLAVNGVRPVSVIVADVSSLSSAERDRAIDNLTAERIAQARKQADLEARESANPASKAVIDPILVPVGNFITRADQVLDGLFANIAGAETPASLRAGTVPPSAAQKPQIESALKPDLRVTAAGSVAAFEENIAGDPVCDPSKTTTCYLDRLRKATPPLIAAHHHEQVDNRGKAEHDDRSKVHALSELERVGNASKRETDHVFGKYKKGPSLKADTKTARGNIHDLWKDTDTDLKGMTIDQKREMAQKLVFYFYQSDSEISAINALHNADPKFTRDGAPVNQEAKDQKKVVVESTKSTADVRALNEIDRGWDASAQAGQVNIQIFKQPDQTSGPLKGPNVADRDFLWDMFQTLIHEYLHTLAHPAYNRFADSFGDTSNQNNTLVEGVDSLLDEVVWSAVEPHVNDPALRADVEGPVYSKLPPMKIAPASRRRYDSYTQAVKLVNIVGIRNLYAAYFLGEVSKIKV